MKTLLWSLIGVGVLFDSSAATSGELAPPEEPVAEAAKHVRGEVDVSMDPDVDLDPWFDDALPDASNASPAPVAQCTGILHSSKDVCCNTTCGVCGGEGCSQRPGGTANCCVTAIRASSRFCLNSSPGCRMW